MTPETAASGFWSDCPSCRKPHAFPSPEAPAIHCSRCHAQISFRKPDAVQRTSALVISGLIFYVPANILPVMTITITGQTENLTIWGGVMELYDSGLAPVAAIVFFASILVPLFKLLGLSWILLALEKTKGIRTRDRVYTAIHTFGRWSMVDVYLLSVLVAVGQLGILASVVARPGAIFFCLVLVLTLFATELFDRRLIWDFPEKAAAVKPKGQP